MKKRLTALITCLILGLSCIYAQEEQAPNEESEIKWGMSFGGGLETSLLLRPYIYESTAFVIQPTEYFNADFGVRILLNPFKNSQEPFFYVLPTLNITFYHFYIGGGAFFDFTDSDMQVGWHARSGVVFGDWDWGTGKGNLNIGLSISPTVFIVDAEDSEDSSAKAGAAIASIFTSLFNILKLEVGVTWFLPF